MTIHQKLIRQAATPAEQRYLDLYADVAERLPGAKAPAVRAWRETALDQFALVGLPHRRVEEWKYTDLRVLMPEVYPLAGAEAGKAPNADLDKALGAKLAGLDVIARFSSMANSSLSFQPRRWRRASRSRRFGLAWKKARPQALLRH